MTDEIKQRIEQIKRGEVPKGYKKTKVGIVPEEWECKTFDELFDFYGGLGIARDLLGDNGVPYLHYGDMHKNSFTKVEYEDYLKMPKYDINISGAETYLLKHGDLVFLDASEDLNGTSRCVLVYNPENKPFISGLHTFRAMAKDESIQLAFKQYITIPQKVRKQFMRLASGFKVYGVNGSTIKKISVSYPKDKNEQQRVADILSKWDEAIALQEKLIEKLEVQKKALMQRLLAPKEGWKKSKLNEIATKQKAKLVNNMENGKFPIIDMEFLINEKFVNFTNDSGVKASYNDVLLLWDGSGAGTVICNIEGIVGSTFARLTPSRKILSKYLYYYLLMIKYKTTLLREGSGVPHIPKDFMSIQQIEYPNPMKQGAIVRILDMLSIQSKHQTQKLSKLKQQQKALHQLLLTGIVRV